MGITAVTGASGFIGRALARELAARGARLRGLFRSASARAERWRERGHGVVPGDLADPEALASLVEGAGVVYHLAVRKAKDDPEASHRVNVEGTRRLARAAARAGVDRLVYVSTISVYAATEPSDPGATAVERSGPGDAQVLTEEVEPRKVELLNPYSRTKYGGERALRALGARGEAPPWTIVRPTNVYGPWGRSWFLDWVERIERFPVVIGGDVPVDVVHVEDLADALVAAAGSEGAAGEVLHVGDRWIPLAEYVSRLGEAVGRSVRRLPASVDRLVRHAITAGHRAWKKNRMSMPLTRRIQYPHEKASRLIGYEPQVSLEEGLERLGRWYREVYLPGR